MQFDSWSEFVAMGGYGFFVWLAFGVSVLAMALILIDSVRQRRVLKDKLNSELARKARIEAVKRKKDMNNGAAQAGTSNEPVSQNNVVSEVNKS